MHNNANGMEAEALTRRVNAVVREIEQFKRERADAAARTARVRLAAAQTMKRQRRVAERAG